MNKEPIGLYIFRYVMGFGLFAFMAMLYWSSVIVEEKLINLQLELNESKNDLSALRSDIAKIHEDILDTLQQAAQNNSSSSSQILTPSSAFSQKETQAAQSTVSYQNLLNPDLFYSKVLPHLLGKNFKPSGTLNQATLGKPVNLHPFSNWQSAAAWHSQCLVAVAKPEFGKYETLTPDMAVRMELRHRASDGAVEYWIFLRDNVYWQPLNRGMFTENINMAPHFLRRHKVTAHDFKFYFDAIMNPFVQEAGAISLRTYLSDLEEITVVDDLTFVARWKTKNFTNTQGKQQRAAKYIAQQMTASLRPLASFVYKYFPNGQKIVNDDSDEQTYRTNSVWAQNFAQHWARNIIPSCGAWIFEKMTDREIRFKRNPDHYDHLEVLVQDSVTQFKDTPESIWQAFKTNKIDLYTLQPEQIIELTKFKTSKQYLQQAQNGSGIEQLDYMARTYSYIGWNEANPLFKNVKVRQALTLAIDRNRIIQQYLNGQGEPINGPFYPYSPNYDKNLEPWPFDSEKAVHLLQQEGWYDSDGDGIIDKMIDGVLTPFVFHLTYYVKNPITKSVVEYIATALKEIGITCYLLGVDVADLSAAFDDKNFDAIALGWSLGSPPEDLRQLWSSAGAKEKGSSNAIGFANAEVDAIIDTLDYTFDLQERTKLYHRFGQIIYEECPYTFLYAPKTTLLYRHYLQNVWIPAERQDLIPGANVAEPSSSIYWIQAHAELSS